MSTVNSFRQRTSSPIARAFLLAAVMFAATSLFTPGFASSSHIRFMLVSAAFIGIVAAGQTVVVIGGGIDLSIPYVLTSTALLSATWADGTDTGLAWAIPAALLFAIVVGLANGLGISVFGVSPIIMTLGMNVLLQGFLLIYLKGQQAPETPDVLQNIATETLGGVPIPLWIWLGVALVTSLLLSVTTFGRRLYALGDAPTVARFSGVRVWRVQVLSYVFSALMAGIAGLLISGFVSQAYLGLGDSFLFASVAAVAIGGAPLLGGSGHYLGTVAGALVLTLLAGLLPVFNLSAGWQDILYGLTILGTVALAVRHAGKKPG